MPDRQTRMLEVPRYVVARERQVHVGGEGSSGPRAQLIFHEARILGSASRMVRRNECILCSSERIFDSAIRMGGIRQRMPGRHSRIDVTRPRIRGAGARISVADARIVGAGARIPVVHARMVGAGARIPGKVAHLIGSESRIRCSEERERETHSRLRVTDARLPGYDLRMPVTGRTVVARHRRIK